MPNIIFRGTKKFRPLYVLIAILDHINHRIAARNIQQFPQLAIVSFDNIGLRINLEGRYEADDLGALSRFLTECINIDTSTTAVDIGANIGNHAVFFSKIFDRVLAFEPNPRVYELLKYNCAGSNIVPVNRGLSRENSTLTLSIPGSNLGGARIIDANSSPDALNSNTVDVEVVRLDDAVQIEGHVVSLIKIDVEGHELQVLEGAVRLIENEHPIIVFEQSPNGIVDGTSEVIDFLRSRNYQFFTIQSNFYLGQGIAARIISLLLRMAFGFRRDIVPTHQFKRKFYSMVIAIPGHLKYSVIGR